jgi:hypothetical protein
MSEWTEKLTAIHVASKDIRQFLEELQRRGGWIGRRTSDNHILLQYRNGRMTTCPGTPRNGWRTLRNMRAKIRAIEEGRDI